MKKLIVFVLLIIIAVACSENKDSIKSDKMNIVVSILPYKSFVENVVGDDFDITVMIPPGANPETYELTPQQMIKLSEADLYIMVGTNFDFETQWLSKIQEEYPSIKFVNPGKDITIKNQNPHIWLGPNEAKQITSEISKYLVEQFPDKKEIYETNTKHFIENIDKVVDEYSLKFDDVSNKTILSYHPAWIYVTSTFGLEDMSIEKEGKEPNAQSLAKIIEVAKTKKLNTIFVEPQFNKTTANTIANEIGASLVEINPLPEDYLDNLKDMLNKMYESLL